MRNSIRIRAAGVLLQGDQILLVRHEKHGRSYWLLPGGGVDYGETAESALIREFKEECNLDVKIGPLVLVHDSIPPDKHRQVLNLYFTVERTGGELKAGDDAVMKGVQFHPIDELSRMEIYPRVVPQILEGIRSDWKIGCRYLGNIWDK